MPGQALQRASARLFYGQARIALAAGQDAIRADADKRRIAGSEVYQAGISEGKARAAFLLDHRAEGGIPALADRDFWGSLVRELWVAWAREQTDPKPSWLVPWGELCEADREADRRIGTGVAEVAMGRADAGARSDRIEAALAERKRCADLIRARAAELAPDSLSALSQVAAASLLDGADLIEGRP